MTSFIHLLLRALLLPLFVLLIAPIGLIVRVVADPMRLGRSSRESYLRPAKKPSTVAGLPVDARLPRRA